MPACLALLLRQGHILNTACVHAVTSARWLLVDTNLREVVEREQVPGLCCQAQAGQRVRSRCAVCLLVYVYVWEGGAGRLFDPCALLCAPRLLRSTFRPVRTSTR